MTMETLLFILLAVLAIFIVTTIIRAIDDAKTYDADLRCFVYRMRNLPVNEACFQCLKDEFAGLKRRGRDERLDVAFVEFAHKYKSFFPELNHDLNVAV